MKDPVSNCLVNQIKSKQNKNKLARFFYFPLLLGCEVLLGTEAKVVVRERCYIPPVPFQLMHRQTSLLSHTLMYFFLFQSLCQLWLQHFSGNIDISRLSLVMRSLYEGTQEKTQSRKKHFNRHTVRIDRLMTPKFISAVLIHLLNLRLPFPTNYQISSLECYQTSQI